MLEVDVDPMFVQCPIAKDTYDTKMLLLTLDSEEPV